MLATLPAPGPEVLASLTWLQILPWVALYPAAALLWVPSWRRIALSLATAGYALAFVAGELSVLALLSFASLLLAGWAVASSHRRVWRTLGVVLFILTILPFRAHIAPGFHNLHVSTGSITMDAVPFNLYLNLDKSLILFWLVLFWPDPTLVRPWRQWLPVGIAGALITTAACIVFAITDKLVMWEPKISSLAPIWFIDNLVLVCATEEVLFRSFIQDGIGRWFERFAWGPWLALAVSAFLFGMAHFADGPHFMVLSMVAGVGYGLAYRWGGLPAAVVAHAGLNSIHFFLFTYPLLRP